jgi:hypothetical protein
MCATNGADAQPEMPRKAIIRAHVDRMEVRDGWIAPNHALRETDRDHAVSFGRDPAFWMSAAAREVSSLGRSHRSASGST